MSRISPKFLWLTTTPFTSSSLSTTPSSTPSSTTLFLTDLNFEPLDLTPAIHSRWASAFLWEFRPRRSNFWEATPLLSKWTTIWNWLRTRVALLTSGTRKLGSSSGSSKFTNQGLRRLILPVLAEPTVVQPFRLRRNILETRIAGQGLIQSTRNPQFSKVHLAFAIGMSECKKYICCSC